MDYSKKAMKKKGLIKALEKKYGKGKEGRLSEIIREKGSKGLPQRSLKKGY